MMRGAAGWRVLAAGVGVMLCVGTSYSWSVFTRPLMAIFGWSSLQVGVTFAILIFGVGCGALCGGLFVDRFGPRRIGAAGTAMWGLGSILAGLGTPHLGLLWLYATYGAIGGFGSGMAYIVPGAAVTKWFPQRRGLVNGIVLMAFGMGSLAFNTVVDALPGFRAVADAAGTLIAARNAATRAGHAFVLPHIQRAADVDTVMHVFLWSGIVLFVVGVGSALGLAVPPAVARAADDRDAGEFRWREMLRTPAFYAIYAIVFVDGFAGLAVLGNAVPIYAELTSSGAATAAIVYGWLSIFNGLGRLFWPWMSDTFGRMRCLAAAFALQGAAIGALAYLHAPFPVMAAFALLLLCFGGILGITPAVVADYYGVRFLGENYGTVITAIAFSGLAGPLLFGLFEDVTGSLTHAMLPVALVALAASLLPLSARRPARAAFQPASSAASPRGGQPAARTTDRTAARRPAD